MRHTSDDQTEVEDETQGGSLLLRDGLPCINITNFMDSDRNVKCDMVLW